MTVGIKANIQSLTIVDRVGSNKEGQQAWSSTPDATCRRTPHI
jgi:hypothetical protein